MHSHKRPAWKKIGVQHEKYQGSNYSGRSGRSPSPSHKFQKSINTSLENDIEIPTTHKKFTSQSSGLKKQNSPIDPMAQFMKKMQQMGLECEQVQQLSQQGQSSPKRSLSKISIPQGQVIKQQEKQKQYSDKVKSQQKIKDSQIFKKSQKSLQLQNFNKQYEAERNKGNNVNQEIKNKVNQQYLQNKQSKKQFGQNHQIKVSLQLPINAKITKNKQNQQYQIKISQPNKEKQKNNQITSRVKEDTQREVILQQSILIDTETFEEVQNRRKSQFLKKINKLQNSEKNILQIMNDEKQDFNPLSPMIMNTDSMISMHSIIMIPQTHIHKKNLKKNKQIQQKLEKLRYQYINLKNQAKRQKILSDKFITQMSANIKVEIQQFFQKIEQIQKSKDISQYQNKIKELQQIIQYKQQNVKNLQSKINELIQKKENQRIIQENMQMNQKIEQLMEINQQIRNQCQQVKQQRQRLIFQKQQIENLKLQYETQVQKLNQLILKYQFQHNNFQQPNKNNIIVQNKNDVTRFQQQIQVVKQQYSQSLSEKILLNKKLQSTQIRVQQLSKLVQQLEDQIDEQQQKIKIIQNLQKDKQKMKQIIQEQRLVIDQLKEQTKNNICTEKSQQSLKLQEMIQQNEKLKELKSKLQVKIQKIQVQNQNLRKNNKNSQYRKNERKNNDQQRLKKQMLQIDYQKMKQIIKIQNERIKKLDDENVLLRDRLDQISIQGCDKNSQYCNKTDLQNEVDKNKILNQDLAKQRDKNRLVMIKNQDLCQKLIKFEKNLQQINNQYQNKFEEKKYQQQKQIKLMEKIRFLQEQYKRNQQEIFNLRQQISNFDIIIQNEAKGVRLQERQILVGKQQQYLKRIQGLNEQIQSMNDRYLNVQVQRNKLQKILHQQQEQINQLRIFKERYFFQQQSRSNIQNNNNQYSGQNISSIRNPNQINDMSNKLPIPKPINFDQINNDIDYNKNHQIKNVSDNSNNQYQQNRSLSIQQNRRQIKMKQTSSFTENNNNLDAYKGTFINNNVNNMNNMHHMHNMNGINVQNGNVNNHQNYYQNQYPNHYHDQYQNNAYSNRTSNDPLSFRHMEIKPQNNNLNNPHYFANSHIQPNYNPNLQYNHQQFHQYNHSNPFLHSNQNQNYHHQNHIHQYYENYNNQFYPPNHQYSHMHPYQYPYIPMLPLQQNRQTPYHRDYIQQPNQTQTDFLKSMAQNLQLKINGISNYNQNQKIQTKNNENIKNNNITIQQRKQKQSDIFQQRSSQESFNFQLENPRNQKFLIFNEKQDSKNQRIKHTNHLHVPDSISIPKKIVQSISKNQVKQNNKGINRRQEERHYVQNSPIVASYYPQQMKQKSKVKTQMKQTVSDVESQQNQSQKIQNKKQRQNQRQYNFNINKKQRINQTIKSKQSYLSSQQSLYKSNNVYDLKQEMITFQKEKLQLIQKEFEMKKIADKNKRREEELLQKQKQMNQKYQVIQKMIESQNKKQQQLKKANQQKQIQTLRKKLQQMYVLDKEREKSKQKKRPQKRVYELLKQEEFKNQQQYYQPRFQKRKENQIAKRNISNNRLQLQQQKQFTTEFYRGQTFGSPIRVRPQRDRSTKFDDKQQFQRNSFRSKISNLNKITPTRRNSEKKKYKQQENYDINQDYFIKRNHRKFLQSPQKQRERIQKSRSFEKQNERDLSPTLLRNFQLDINNNLESINYHRQQYVPRSYANYQQQFSNKFPRQSKSSKHEKQQNFKISHNNQNMKPNSISKLNGNNLLLKNRDIERYTSYNPKSIQYISSVSKIDDYEFYPQSSKNYQNRDDKQKIAKRKGKYLDLQIQRIESPKIKRLNKKENNLIGNGKNIQRKLDRLKDQLKKQMKNLQH